MCVKLGTQQRFGALATKFRSTGSYARSTDPSGIVMIALEFDGAEVIWVDRPVTRLDWHTLHVRRARIALQSPVEYRAQPGPIRVTG
ncbi:hypothetical protein GCM10010315_44420 [Streptomyces luteosporeus]|uniref:Transposase n=2 Tax=Streptomyces TaxID=1883 RepID=A0ABN3TZ49_9ACTN